MVCRLLYSARHLNDRMFFKLNFLFIYAILALKRIHWMYFPTHTVKIVVHCN